MDEKQFSNFEKVIHVIQRVIDAYNHAIGSSYRMTRHPDSENRGSDDIDAYAERSDLGALAIEHTKIQSLQDQYRSSAWFTQGLGTLEKELTGIFSFCLIVEFPYRNVEPGHSWPTIREVIKAWLLANAPAFPFGRTTRQLPGVPFLLTLTKLAIPAGRVYLSRAVPPGERDVLLLGEMQRSLDHKYAKLGEYQKQGAASILVLESEDIALASPQSLYRAYLQALRERPRPNLDQVWLVCTFADDWVYCFSGPPDVMAGVNPPNFRFGPQFIGEWLQEPWGEEGAPDK